MLALHNRLDIRHCISLFKYLSEKKIISCIHHYEDDSKDCPGIGYTCWVLLYGKLCIGGFGFSHISPFHFQFYIYSHIAM